MKTGNENEGYPVLYVLYQVFVFLLVKEKLKKKMANSLFFLFFVFFDFLEAGAK